MKYSTEDQPELKYLSKNQDQRGWQGVSIESTQTNAEKARLIAIKLGYCDE